MTVASVLRSIDTIVHKILLFIAQLALVAMIVIVCATVYYRYVLNYGIVWAEEMPRTLVALFAFIACAMGVRDRLHISVDFIYNRFKVGGVGRRILDVAFDISVFACGAIMTVYGWKLCAPLWHSTMAGTGLPRAVQYISAPIAGVIIMYDSLLFLFGVLKKDDRLFSEKEETFEVIHVKKDAGSGATGGKA